MELSLTRKKEESGVLRMWQGRAHFMALSGMERMERSEESREEGKKDQTRRQEGGRRRRWGRKKNPTSVKLVRGPFGTYVAPSTGNASNLVYASL